MDSGQVYRLKLDMKFFQNFFLTSKKLSRSDAILEFATNSNTSLNVTLECREIKLQIHGSRWFPNSTSYFLFEMPDLYGAFSCEERGLTELCTTTIEGEKCSFKFKVFILVQLN